MQIKIQITVKLVNNLYVSNLNAQNAVAIVIKYEQQCLTHLLCVGHLFIPKFWIKDEKIMKEIVKR